MDVLVGILYQNMFPRPVFSLENELTIFEMRVNPHDANIKAGIGGPHCTFRHLAQRLVVFLCCLQIYQDSYKITNNSGRLQLKEPW